MIWTIIRIGSIWTAMSVIAGAAWVLWRSGMADTDSADEA